MRIGYLRRYKKRAARRMPSIKPASSRSASRASLARSGGDGMIGPSPRNGRPDGEGCQAVATSAPAPLATPEPAGERPAALGPRQPCAMDRLEAVSPQRQLLAGCECSSCRNWRHIADLTWHARTTGLELGVPKMAADSDKPMGDYVVITRDDGKIQRISNRLDSGIDTMRGSSLPGSPDSVTRMPNGAL